VKAMATETTPMIVATDFQKRMEKNHGHSTLGVYCDEGRR
jgi:hypothetical protein